MNKVYTIGKYLVITTGKPAQLGEIKPGDFFVYTNRDLGDEVPRLCKRSPTDDEEGEYENDFGQYEYGIGSDVLVGCANFYIALIHKCELVTGVKKLSRDARDL